MGNNNNNNNNNNNIVGYNKTDISGSESCVIAGFGISGLYLLDMLPKFCV
jgi:hypothetical protein